MNAATLRGNLTTAQTDVYDETKQQSVSYGPLDLTFLYQTSDRYNLGGSIPITQLSLGGTTVTPISIQLYPNSLWDGVDVSATAANGDLIVLGYPFEIGSLFGSLSVCPGYSVFKGVEPTCGSVLNAIGVHSAIPRIDGTYDQATLEVSLLPAQVPEPSTAGNIVLALFLTLVFAVERRWRFVRLATTGNPRFWALRQRYAK